MTRNAPTQSRDPFASLTEGERAALPDENAIASYRNHGYWISPVLFDDDAIEQGRCGIERFYQGDHDFQLSDQISGLSGWKPKDGGGMRLNDYVALLNGDLAALVTHRLIGAIAALLSGRNSIRLWHDQFIFKPGGAGDDTAIGWHTDRSYWPTCSSTDMLTAWIPLQDTTEDMGTLLVVDGSHLWMGDTVMRGFHGRALGELSPKAARHVVPLELKAGQVSFHHCRTIHGSGANRSVRPRLSISAHLQDGDNRFHQSTLPNGEMAWHRNDLLVRKRQGMPDYTDPDICPQIWPTDRRHHG